MKQVLILEPIQNNKIQPHKYRVYKKEIIIILKYTITAI